MTARARAPEWAEPRAVSALFRDPADVDRALARLIRAGVPRDLIDIVVAPAAAARYYPERARRLGHEAIRYAGIGGLSGLILGAVGSLTIIVLPGFAAPGIVALVQLLGPNFATVTGAMIGAAVGLFVQRRGERRHRRAAEAPDAIVVVATARTVEEEEALARLLTESGGSDPRLEE